MTYAFLAEGRNEQEMVELDALLSPDPVGTKAKGIDRANMEAMQRLKEMMGGVGGPPMPPGRRG